MDDLGISPPAVLEAINRESERIGFTMASEPRTGALLRLLAAARPGGRLLELGTGTGVGTAWLLDGMDAQARLESVDTDLHVQEVARRHLGSDRRVTFQLVDGASFLAHSPPGSFDLVYADAWPGKFTHLDLALSQLRPGGLYVIDDLLPQPNWPDGHGSLVSKLIAQLDRQEGFIATKLAWASGLMILARTG